MTAKKVGMLVGRALYGRIPGLTFSAVDAMGFGLACVILLAVGYPIYLVFDACRHWFLFGDWTGSSFQDLIIRWGMNWPSLHAVGGQRIIDWFGSWPAWLAMATIEATVGIWITVQMSNDRSKGT